MHRKPGELLPLLHAVAEAENGAATETVFALDILDGTVVSGIAFDECGHLRVTGSHRAGSPCWGLTIRCSARFTFANVSESGGWLVEANYDAGGTVRSSDRAMMLAACGAVVESAWVDAVGLHIRSGDGRGIEVVHAVNGEEELVLEIAAEDGGADPILIALPADLESLGFEPDVA